MWDTHIFRAKTETKVGCSATGKGKKEDSWVIDDSVFHFWRSRWLAVEELGHLNRDNPILEAEQPVNDYREEEEQEDGRWDGPSDLSCLGFVVSRLLVVVTARKIECHKVLQDTQYVHELDPRVPRLPEDVNRCCRRYKYHGDADYVRDPKSPDIPRGVFVCHLFEVNLI